MKSRNLAAFFIMLACIVFALCWGAQKGWSSERREVEAAYDSLEDMLKTRIETANNILTVAGRHLDASDTFVAALKSDRDALADTGAGLTEKAAANEALETDALALLKKMAALDSVKADSRDSMYVAALLPQMLSDSGEFVTRTAYNEAAKSFNARFRSNFVSGTLARLLGVEPAQEFTQNKE